MSVRSLQQGIEAVQKGHLEEGARLLRLAIRDETLAPHLKATAFAWLSNTQEDTAFKIECYQKAVASDPQNTTYAQHLNMLLAAQVPAPKQPAPPPPPVQPTTFTPPQPPGTGSVGVYPAPSTQPLDPFAPSGSQPIYPSRQQPDPYTAPRQQPDPYAAPRSTGTYPAANPNSTQYPPLRGSDFMPSNRPAADPFGPSGTGTYPAANPNAGMGQGGYSTRPTDPFAGGGTPLPTSTGTFSALPNMANSGLTLNEVQRSVGIVGGPNGKGSGLFVTRDGLIATSRFVVGSEESLTVQLANGQAVAGRVLRSFPQYDLAFVKVPIQLVALMPMSQMPILAENVTLTVLSHPGEMIRTARRETRGELPPQWFPTLLNRLQDAGGDPIFDPQNAIVGMMTRNTSRSTGYFYGLHINAILQCAQLFLQEAQQLGNQGIYCTSCGSSSRAGAFKAYYCETCGSVLPPAMEIRRRPLENVGALYGETMQRPCPNCRATVGYYNGVCLRCGFDVSQRR